MPAAIAPMTPLTEFKAPALPVFVAPAAVPVEVKDSEDVRALPDPVERVEPVPV